MNYAQIAADHAAMNVFLVVGAACIGALLVLVVFASWVFKDHNASPALPGGKPDGWRRTPNSMVPFEPIYEESSAQPLLDKPVAHCDRVGNDGWRGWQSLKKNLKTDM